MWNYILREQITLVRVVVTLLRVNCGKFRLSVSVSTADFMLHIIFISLKKIKNYKNYDPKNFMYNRKLARHTKIAEYETIYFPKAIKFDE
jgi:hypothetical protein